MRPLSTSPRFSCTNNALLDGDDSDVPGNRFPTCRVVVLQHGSSTLLVPITTEQ